MKTTALKYFTPTNLIDERITVLLIGAGGTGSEMLDVLARLHHGLLGVGHPGGLHVTVMDGDEVSAEANVGRQRFSPQDNGINKSIILVHRYNLFYGLDWEAIPAYWAVDKPVPSNTVFDLLITCVDRASTRVDIAHHVDKGSFSDNPLWLDNGNGKDKAQIVLGHLLQKTPSSALRLPNVHDLFPELQSVNDNDAPSCSLAEALRSQDLMINRIVADCAGAILWKLLREGGLEQHGAFIDLKTLTVNPLLINREVWQFLGYDFEELAA